MNREIKFRAWNKKEKYIELVDDLQMFNNQLYIGIPGEDYFLGKDDVELMQYTGLHDKNGKEIYEGDIVEITRPCILERGEVKFINGCFDIKSKDTLLMLYQCEINNFKLKVIGNIYDNPELLGGE